MIKEWKRKPTGSVALGKLISETRKAKKMTGAKLATLVGVDRTHISKIEHGVHSPDFSVLMKITRKLENPNIIDLYFEEQHKGMSKDSRKKMALESAMKINKILKERNIDFNTLYEEITNPEKPPPTTK